jgi:UDP-glucose 4-epimerase
MGLNWLITGGCGFVGSNLIDALLSQGGHSLRILDNLSTGKLANSAKKVSASIEFIQGDIRDEQLALKAAEDIDVIVHLAGNTGVAPSVEDPFTDCMSNVIGTLNYLEAARRNKVKRFVFASSSAPVGECVPPIHEKKVPYPVSPYGASKLAGEGYCSAYFRTFNVPTVVLRFSNVYGPYSIHKSSIIPKFIRRALSGEELHIYGDGNQTRDFLYVHDMVRAILQSSEQPEAIGETFQIATGVETSLNRLVETLKGVLQSRGLKDLPVVYREPRLGDVLKNYSSIEKARSVLQWSPEMQLVDGLQMTVEWFVDNR